MMRKDANALRFMKKGPGCAPAPEVPAKTVPITVNDKMHYDLNAFEVKPGQKVFVTLTNVDTSPKASMGHNFLLLKQNTNVQKFFDAGRAGLY
jgi:azurin